MGAHVVADAGHDLAEMVQVLVGQVVEQQPGDLEVAGHDPAEEGPAGVGDGDQGGAFVVGAGAAGDEAGIGHGFPAFRPAAPGTGCSPGVPFPG